MVPNPAPQTPASLRDEITALYYRTTSGRGHRPTNKHYETAANLLRWRLGPWMPRQKSSRCLDLACGCGEMIYCLEREGFENTAGVDLCREEIEEGRLFVRGDLVHSDVLEYLRLTDSKSVDFVTAFNFLEHLPKDYLREVLLQTGGCCGPRVLWWEWYQTQFPRSVESRDTGISHMSGLSHQITSFNLQH